MPRVVAKRDIKKHGTAAAVAAGAAVAAVAKNRAKKTRQEVT